MLMGRTPSRGEAQGWLQGKAVVLIICPAPLAVVISMQRHYLMQPSKPRNRLARQSLQPWLLPPTQEPMLLSILSML